MHVSEICAVGIFVTFPWWLKNVKSRSKIAFFFKWAPFWNLISKKKIITFFWSKLSKLHKNDPILHVTTTFSLKQGETRTNSVPIRHPLMFFMTTVFKLLFFRIDNIFFNQMTFNMQHVLDNHRNAANIWYFGCKRWRHRCLCLWQRDSHMCSFQSPTITSSVSAHTNTVVYFLESFDQFLFLIGCHTSKNSTLNDDLKT